MCSTFSTASSIGEEDLQLIAPSQRSESCSIGAFSEGSLQSRQSLVLRPNLPSNLATEFLVTMRLYYFGEQVTGSAIPSVIWSSYCYSQDSAAMRSLA